MRFFNRKNPDFVGLGRDEADIDGEAPLSVAVPNGPVTPPSEDPDAPAPAEDAPENLEALIRETEGGTASGKISLSKEEKVQKAREAKDAKAAVKAEKKAARMAAKVAAKEAKASGEAPVKNARKPFAFPRRKPSQDDQEDEIELIAEPDTRMSASVVIEFLQGYAKDDAVTWAKRWAMDKMSVPSDCYYFVQKYPGGYAVEIQEGVGQAYLPSVINLATRNPGRMVVVPMSRRKMTVRFTERADDFEAYILPEGQEPPVTGVDPLVARRTAKMKPILQQNVHWLYAGVATAAIGGVFLLASLMVYALDPAAKVPPEWRTTAIPRLPVMQWNRLQPDATDSYVVRMEFSDGQWRIIRQASGATAEVATPEIGPDSAIVGGAVAAPTTPDGTGSVPPPPPPGVVVTPLNGAPGAAPSQIPPPAAVSGR